jgi:hypothetical protein
MTTNDELDRTLEARVRSWVREEIVAAFKVMGRAADYENGYETPELDSRALDNIERVAEGAVRRLTCEHPSYSNWGDSHTCTRCGEPEPGPVNPFETEEETNAR